MKTVMVLGAGTMGSGIAQVCAASGYKVYFWDLTKALAESGKNRIGDGLSRQVERRKMTCDTREKILDNIVPTTDLSLAAEAKLVMEVVVEDIKIKKDLYSRVEPFCKVKTVIGTNTSFIPISKLAEDLEHPERFVGIHFFVPVYAMKLVEVIRGEKTNTATMNAAADFARSLGKETVTVNNDAPGFIVNRINMATYAEAIKVLQEGVATVEDIDKALKLGLNYPMGPFELMDYGGLATMQACFKTLYELTGDERFKPVPEIDAKVEAGDLGRKTGKGFYDYDKAK